MKQPAQNTRRGLSLVELLVVVTIIGVLIALVLPAIQAAREAARRSACLDHLRQTSLAVIHRAETRGARLPALWATDRMDPWENFSWRADILAEVEQQATAEQLHRDSAPLDSINLRPASVQIPVFQCPSTPGYLRSIAAMGSAAGSGLSYDGLQLAACDYAACYEVTTAGADEPLAGAWKSGEAASDEATIPGSEVLPTAASLQQRTIAAPLRAVADGLSRTILLVEQAGKPDRFKATGLVPSAAAIEGPWATAEWGAFYAAGVNQDNHAGLFGFHAGANVAMCDGAAMTIGADAEWSVVAALMTRDGQEIIDRGDWQ